MPGGQPRLLRKAALLMVSYYFPPWGGGPVLRTLKMAKYLARAGWDITVLAADPRNYEAVSDDPSLLDELPPSVRCLRTGSLLPSLALVRRLQAEATGDVKAQSRTSRWLVKITRYLHQLLIPDDKVLWLPHGLFAAIISTRHQRFDAIYCTVPPHSASLLGVLASYLRRVPLLLDFRDDWVGNPLFSGKSHWARRIDAKLEAWVTGRAAAILVPTEASARLLAKKYPGVVSRVHVVPNGFDEEDLPLEPRRGRYPPDDSPRTLRCVYAGLVTERRNLLHFARTLRRMNEADEQYTVQLRIAGFIPLALRQELAPMARQGWVKDLGYLPHGQVLREIVRSDVAVVVSTASEGASTAVPSKLYEYVACGVPVLGLVDPGPTREFIQRHGCGLVCSPGDQLEIEAALEEFKARKRSGTIGSWTLAPNELRAYSRRRAAETVAAVMNQVTGL